MADLDVDFEDQSEASDGLNNRSFKYPAVANELNYSNTKIRMQ